MNGGGKDGKTVIAGAGPAGASLAIRLARAGREVLLVERTVFPRHKLCGEFISPECLDHFADLGVLERMCAAGGDRIGRTVFYSMSGKSADVPSKWFGAASSSALGLSRAAMDDLLLCKAAEEGVEVLQGTAVTGVNTEAGAVRSLYAKRGRDRMEIEGGVFIDATGRQRVLAKHVSRDRGKRAAGSGLVGFKAHFRNVSIEPGTCEIYFFPGGYGGLSFVENGIANHCFLMESGKARQHGADADRITRELIFANPRAKAALEGAEREFDWLAVAVDGFGTRDLAPARNLFAVGDAGAFIDPFTGSGMLMALESAEILAGAIKLKTLEEAAAAYRAAHRARFRKRLLLCSVMRRLSFRPGFSSAAVAAAAASSGLRRMIARNTRGGLFDPRG